ncbi:MAG: terminase small subunit [Rhizobiaceae bacterium]|nr:terminase small subunit [Rhizobiaceae bacterium]
MSELTPKQEAFALAYVETGNASEAYRRSYDVSPDTKPESIWVNASKLLADAKVSQRVKELQKEARALSLVTVGTLTQELDEARQKAMAEAKGASAAVSATMGKAKLHGLLVDKVAQTDTSGKDIPDASNRELAKAVALLLQKGMKEAGGSGA